MDFDSIVILPFLDFFSFMKSVVGMEVQVHVSSLSLFRFLVDID